MIAFGAPAEHFLVACVVNFFWSAKVVVGKAVELVHAIAGLHAERAQVDGSGKFRAGDIYVVVRVLAEASIEILVGTKGAGGSD